MEKIDLNGKTILVTGSAGFIGSNLVKRLFKDLKDAIIVGIDNMNDYYDVSLKEWRLKEIEGLVPAGIKYVFVKGDIASKETIDQLFETYKPQVPKSHWAVPPFYIYRKADLDLVRHSVENGCGKDAPGNLAHYMVDHTTMHAWRMSAGRFDIGSLDTYYEAVEKYGK